jgi:hypothetical protein
VTRIRVAKPDPSAFSYAHRADGDSRPGPTSVSTDAIRDLQRTIGNTAVGRLVSVQRWIKIRTPQPESLAPALLASRYTDKYKDPDPNWWTRARAACVVIDATGEEFETLDAAFDRVTEVMNAREGRAVQPLFREPIAARVAIELDYHFSDIDPKPALTFVETYPTSWDTTGGWGAEYHPPKEGVTPIWVVHVHRGPNGGLKAARVKLWEERKLEQKGMGVSKFDNLAALGVAQVDPKKTH